MKGRTCPMFKIVNNQKGLALLTILVLLILMSLIGITIIYTSSVDMQITDNSRRNTKAFYAAEAGIALGLKTLWRDYINTPMVNPPKDAGEEGTLETYLAYLDNLGLQDSTTLVLFSDYAFKQSAKIDTVKVTRVDESTGLGVILTLVSKGSDFETGVQNITQRIKVEGTPFKGFAFAILANNINCIMCHANIDNAARYWNTDPNQEGTFDRVKIASLESILLRTNSARSKVAGTLYTRGIVTDKDGVPITDLSPTNKGLEGWDFDHTNGKIIEPLSEVDLVNTTGDPLPPYGNFYMNYPTSEEEMTDGVLPTEFPSAIPDENGNKLVDDEEFDLIENGARGSVSGGIIYGVPTGSAYSSNDLPSSSNLSEVIQTYEGNLFLIGTETNPVVINNDIAVDGDVVIKGVFKGSGQIYAKGNIYIVGDVTYADGSAGGSRTFGYADDDTKNALAITAGGNILAGDYLTPKGGSILDENSRDAGDGTTPMSFTVSEITLFNRMEWTKTQPQLKDKYGNLVDNPYYIPGYRPRYYTLGPGDPVYIYNKGVLKQNGKMDGTYFDPTTNTWQGKEHIDKYDTTKYLTQYNPGSPELAGATIISLAPSGWLSESQLKNFWIADENSRPPGSPFKIDALLYTNNSIFTLARRDSKMEGQMQINGAIVAADLGVLVPGNGGVGLQLNYDQRLKEFLKVKDPSKVVMIREMWTTE